MRFLGITLRVLRLEVSVWISEGGMVSIRFSSFLLYNKNCKRFREFEEIERKGKENLERLLCIARGKTFVWISASVLVVFNYRFGVDTSLSISG